MILIEQTTHYKKLPLSWARKLSNAAFTSFSNILLLSIEQIVGDNARLNQMISKVRKANDELNNLSPVVTKHEATKQINKWHAERKQLLTSMTITAKNNANYKHLIDENREEYVFLNNWFSGYGKRLYDLGINDLSGIIQWIRSDYQNDEQFRQSIDLCFKREYADIVALTDQIMQAQLERTDDLVSARPLRGYIEVRRDVLMRWQIFASMLVGDIASGIDEEQSKHIYATMKYFITQNRSIVRERETKRRNREQKEVEAAPINHSASTLLSNKMLHL